jgi:hypothetical protein
MHSMHIESNRDVKSPSRVMYSGGWKGVGGLWGEFCTGQCDVTAPHMHFNWLRNLHTENVIATV